MRPRRALYRHNLHRGRPKPPLRTCRHPWLSFRPTSSFFIFICIKSGPANPVVTSVWSSGEIFGDRRPSAPPAGNRCEFTSRGPFLTSSSRGLRHTSGADAWRPSHNITTSKSRTRVCPCVTMNAAQGGRPSCESTRSGHAPWTAPVWVGRVRPFLCVVPPFKIAYASEHVSWRCVRSTGRQIGEGGSQRRVGG